MSSPQYIIIDLSKTRFLFYTSIHSSGLIGQNWAMIFAGAGYHVTIFDVDPSQLTRAQSIIKTTLEQYEQEGYIRGKLSAVEQMALVSTSSSLPECLSGATYVQVHPYPLQLYRYVTCCMTISRYYSPFRKCV